MSITITVTLYAIRQGNRTRTVTGMKNSRMLTSITRTFITGTDTKGQVEFGNPRSNRHTETFSEHFSRVCSYYWVMRTTVKFDSRWPQRDLSGHRPPVDGA